MNCLPSFSRFALPATLGLAAFVAAPSAALAQDGHAAAGKPEAAKPVDRSALHVTGLTDLNSGVVQIAVEDIAHRAWRCVACEVDRVDEGPCPTCKGPMIPIEETLLCHVVLDVPAGTIHFDVLPDQHVRLSEIQAVLTRFKIVIPPEQQFVPQAATLYVSGPTSKEEVAKLVVNLKDSKLFEKVTGTFDATTQQTVLEVKCVGLPARTEVEGALARAGETFHLVDFGWAAGANAGSRRN